MIPSFEIKTRGNGRMADIYMNGKPVEGVYAYALKHEADSLPLLELTFRCHDVTVDGKICGLVDGEFVNYDD